MNNDVKRIDGFDGEYRFLSNFYSSPFVFADGYTYPSVEAGFQAQKAPIIDRVKYTKCAPNIAKRYGRKEKIDLAEWNSKKEALMYELVKAKFTQNPDLARKLVDTYPAMLTEINTWHDNIWGDCICARCSSRRGENKLGRILMKVREELINAGI